MTFDKQFSKLVNQYEGTPRLQQEAVFKKSKKIKYLFTVPMFTVFYKTEGGNFTDEDIEDFKNNNESRLKEVFAKARNDIGKMGFPSMHANVVIDNINRHANAWATAHSKRKYMTIFWKENPNWIMGDDSDFYNEFSKMIVHEWAHLYMFNHSKAFKKVVLDYYNELRKEGEPSIKITDRETPTLYQEISNTTFAQLKKFIDSIKQISPFWSDAAKKYIFINNKLTPEIYDITLEHNLITNATLKKPVTLESLSTRNTIVKNPGDTVRVQKLASKFAIMAYDERDRRYEILVDYDKIADYLEEDPNVLFKNAQIDEYNKNNVNLDDQALKVQIAEEIKRHMMTFFGIMELNLKIRLGTEFKENVAVYLVLQYLKYLKKYTKFLNSDEIYDYLWMNNKFKPKDFSFEKKIRELLIAKKEKEIAENPVIQGEELLPIRKQMAQLVKWVRAYGMTNDDELWATGIEDFFKLPYKHRQRIVNMMMKGG